MNLRQQALTTFQSLKTFISAKSLTSTSKFKAISNQTLAKLIIISADELVTTTAAEPKNYTNFSSQIIKTYDDYRDFQDRAYPLEQAIGRVLKINTKIIRYSNVHLDHLRIWLSFLERYVNNEQLVQEAKNILRCDLRITLTTFNSAIAELKGLIKKHHKEPEAFSMNTANENVSVTLISNEELHETILLQTKEVVRTYINLDEMDALFPNFAFIKNEIVTLNAVYEDGEYETDINMSFFLTSIDTNFDTVIALITDFDDEINEYDTSLYLISPTKLVKFVQNIFNEKDINFFEVENVKDLLKLVSIM